MAVKLIHLICEGCGQVVNKVEFDPDGRQAKIDQVASTLGVSAEDAAQYVDTHGADPAVQAQEVAQNLANPTDSPCADGCSAPVKVVNA